MFWTKRKRDAMEVSAEVFDEIAEKLGAFLPGHVTAEGWIDLRNICLARGAEAKPPVHRPVAPNAPTRKRGSAPGAIA